MLLTIDVGNTQIVLGIVDVEELVGHWRLTTTDRTEDEMRWEVIGVLALDGFSQGDIKGVAVSSVVPAVTTTLRNVAPTLTNGGDVVIVEPGTKTGMPILIDNPREVGADRIVNALAARERHGARRSSSTSGRPRTSMSSDPTEPI